MAKAGLLGWMLFLPVGEAELPGWGAFLLVAGLLAAFYGVAVGLTQEQPKTILAYSSISQMGFLTVAVGASLFAPASWPVALAAIMVYATHHALAKGALFLGVGVAEKTKGSRQRWQRVLVLAGLLLAALAIAAAPLTSGAAAKEYLKSAAELTPYYSVLSKLLDVATVGSTLLLARFLLFVRPHAGDEEKGPGAGLWAPWAVAVGGVATLILFFPDPISELPELVLSFSALWPVLVGALLAGGAWLLDRRSGGKVRMKIEPGIPEGDLLVPFTWLLGSLRGGWNAYALPARERTAEFLSSQARRSRSGLDRLGSAATKLESWMQFWTVAGGLSLLVAIALLALTALT
jgi:NADH:ubiquinone oxidoreductase subunit 5 (subunit L)/multisubunit Na+/H+ antiporter MnhA subunit